MTKRFSEAELAIHLNAFEAAGRALLRAFRDNQDVRAPLDDYAACKAALEIYLDSCAAAARQDPVPETPAFIGCCRGRIGQVEHNLQLARQSRYGIAKAKAGQPVDAVPA